MKRNLKGGDGVLETLEGHLRQEVPGVVEYVRTLPPADYPHAVVVSDSQRFRFYNLERYNALTEFARSLDFVQNERLEGDPSDVTTRNLSAHYLRHNGESLLYYPQP